jgi:hypothetical protein
MFLEIVSISSFIGSFLRGNRSIVVEKVQVLLVIDPIPIGIGSISTRPCSSSDEKRSRQTCIERIQEENGSILLVPCSIQEEIELVCEIHVSVGERAGRFLAGNASMVTARAFP